jgi:hypothetical protein
MAEAEPDDGMIRQWPVQKAIYGKLTSDATLMGMITGVFDVAPQDQPYPYLLIAEDTGAADDLIDITGAQVTDTIHGWDKNAPVSRMKQIMDRAGYVLHNAALTLEGSTCVACRVEFVNTIPEVDTATHGIMRVRVVSFG